MKPHSISRRSFLQWATVAGLATPYSPLLSKFSAQGTREESLPLEIHIFSKHLQFLSYEDMAAAARQIGFAGADLTVRPGGHVLPERVESDLPKAVAALKNEGLKATMMTTAISDPADPVSRRVLETAARLGIKRYRTNWLSFPDDKSLPEAMVALKEQMQALAALNVELGLEGCYQNHAGTLVGAPMWEVWQLLADADPRGLGAQYDIRHATVEGGLSWENGLRLIQSRIKTIVLKDFIWARHDGRWQAVNTPMGEGMVDFDRYFKLLKQYNIQVPVSLHLEYDLGGAQSGRAEISIPKEQVFEAMKKDLATSQRLWSEA